MLLPCLFALLSCTSCSSVLPAESQFQIGRHFVFCSLSLSLSLNIFSFLSILSKTSTSDILALILSIACKRAGALGSSIQLHIACENKNIPRISILFIKNFFFQFAACFFHQQDKKCIPFLINKRSCSDLFYMIKSSTYFILAPTTKFLKGKFCNE